MRACDVAIAGLVLLVACGSVHEPVVAAGWVPAEAARPLHREDCVRLAVDFAPNAATWKARLDGAEAQLSQASKLPNPTFNINWEDFGLLSATGSRAADDLHARLCARGSVREAAARGSRALRARRGDRGPAGGAAQPRGRGVRCLRPARRGAARCRARAGARGDRRAPEGRGAAARRGRRGGAVGARPRGGRARRGRGGGREAAERRARAGAGVRVRARVHASGRAPARGRPGRGRSGCRSTISRHC